MDKKRWLQIIGTVAVFAAGSVAGSQLGKSSPVYNYAAQTPQYSAKAQVAPKETQPKNGRLAPPRVDMDPVYVTRTGKRWHLSASCAGGGGWIDTWGNAKKRGLTPCGKCA